MPAFSSCVKRDCCLVAVRRASLIAVGFLVCPGTGSRERLFQGSAVVTRGLVAPKHGIFMDQGWTHVLCIGKRILNRWAWGSPSLVTFRVTLMEARCLWVCSEGVSVGLSWWSDLVSLHPWLPGGRDSGQWLGGSCLLFRKITELYSEVTWFHFCL